MKRELSIIKGVKKVAGNKKILITLGVVAGAVTAIGTAYALCKKGKESETDTKLDSNVSAEEIARILDEVKCDLETIQVFNSFGLDVNSVTVNDCCGSKNGVIYFEYEGLIIEAEDKGTELSTKVYQDPLWDFMQQTNR